PFHHQRHQSTGPGQHHTAGKHKGNPISSSPRRHGSGHRRPHHLSQSVNSRQLSDDPAVSGRQISSDIHGQRRNAHKCSAEQHRTQKHQEPARIQSGQDDADSLQQISGQEGSLFTPAGGYPAPHHRGRSRRQSDQHPTEGAV